MVGPESSGKSTLVAGLADLLREAGVGVAVVAEFARDYYGSRPYDPSRAADVLAVAEGQQAAEDAAAARLGVGVLLCDTTVLTCQVWAEAALRGAARRETLAGLRGVGGVAAYALHLVTAPDLPWVADPLRVSPTREDRERLFWRHVAVLAECGAPYVVVRGPDPARRVRTAADAVLAVARAILG